MENPYAPIVLFVYNRPKHTQKTISSLIQNEFADNSLLYIYADGPKENDSSQDDISKVRGIINSVSGFKSVNIIERDKNLGLANSIIQGVTEVLKNYDKAIIVEDDLVSSKYFLSFMNKALENFKEDQKIFSISGYSYPISFPNYYNENIFLSPRASSWGWGTWRNRWEKVDWEISDFDKFITDKKAQADFNKGGNDLTKMLNKQMKGEIDSWAIRWAYAHFKNNAYCLYPLKSKIQNIGNDYSGRHSTSTKKYLVKLDNSEIPDNFNRNIQPDTNILNSMRTFFDQSLYERIYWRIMNILKNNN
ncbi:MAG: glycosyltransferase [Ignavibacteria bacterium]|jgi:hypothetical protein